MKTYKEYEQDALQAKTDAERILATAKAEDRPLSDNEEREFERLRALVGFNQDVARDMREAELESLRAQLTQPVGTAVQTEEKPDLNAFFRNMERDKEYIIRAALSETASCKGEGEYLVGEEWHSVVEKLRFENNFLRSQGARVITTQSTHNIPVLTTLGVAAFVGENAAYSACDPVLAQVILSAYKLTLKVPVSEELMADASYDVAQYLAESTGMSFGTGEEKFMLIGCGSACIQPQGIFSCSTPCQTASCAACFTTTELITHSYKLKREYRKGAVWMMNDSTVLSIAKLGVPMRDATASCTTNVALPYFWTDAVGGEPPLLLGYPVFTNTNIPAAASGCNAICFGNPAFYVIGERGAFVAKRMLLDEYAVTFAFHHRIDGKMLTTDAFKILQMG